MTLAARIGACTGGAAGCRAAFLVDLRDGLLLGAQGAPEAGELLAAAACELLGRARPDALASRADDHAIVASDGALHVFLRIEAASDRALCLIFPPDASSGAALAQARACAEAFGDGGVW